MIRRKPISVIHFITSLVLCCILLLNTSAMQIQAAPTSLSTSNDQKQYAGMNLPQLNRIFKQIEQIRDKDNGAMWGKKLDTKVMIINADTKQFIANHQNKHVTLTKKGALYLGKLPESTMFADSTLHYDGQNWASVIYRKTSDELDLLNTCLHEIFHNNQTRLGIEPNIAKTSSNEEISSDTNPQMDKMKARISIKLEWNALYQAIHDTNPQQKENDIKAALAFRKERRDTYGHAKNENAFEVHEGLTEYTSELLTYGSYTVRTTQLDEQLKEFLDEKQTRTLVRTFGYLSGTFYGILLDDYSSNWRQSV